MFVAAAVAMASIVLAALALAAPVGSVAPGARFHAFCGSSYLSASLPWGHKCLRAGEFCKVGNRAYLRYGFYCPASGHLRRR